MFDGRDSLITGPSGPIATKDNFAIVTQFLEVEGDGGRVGIRDPESLAPSTPLFERRAGNPILTPGGDPVTWGAFRGAEGAVIVKCTRRGTHTTVHLSGLVPKGVYSIWNARGELGPVDGYTALDSKGRPGGATSFRASARGEGHVSGLTIPGSENGTCLLNDVEEHAWRVVTVYHSDGTPDLAEEGAFVEQGGFTFGEAPPPIDVE